MTTESVVLRNATSQGVPSNPNPNLSPNPTGSGGQIGSGGQSGGGKISQTQSDAAVATYKGQTSILIMIIGKSGRGKSTALRTLSPEDTFIINVIGKPLPFPKGISYEPGKNMLISADPNRIRQTMTAISKDPKLQHIRHIIIDDGQYIMATEFMDKAMIKGYNKFTIMARNIWEILILSTKLRPNLKIFFLTHEEETERERKMKTLGKLLEDKITPEGLSTVVMFSDVTGDRNNRRYYFSTQSDGVTNAKTPYGMFPGMIPNDLLMISRRIDEYYAGIELKDSKLNLEI